MCRCLRWTAWRPPPPFDARRRIAGGHTPSSRLTAFAMKGDRERFLAAGFDDYVAKPILCVDLAHAIERVLSTVARQPIRHSFDVAENGEMPYDPQANEVHQTSIHPRRGEGVARR